MDAIETPAFVIDLEKLESNLATLAKVKQEAECHIVLALKAFSLWHTFPLIGEYLDGCCASGIYEAQLSHQKMGKHTLVYSPAYKENELLQLLEFATHIDFNSINQWNTFKHQALSHTRYLNGELKFGLRINPEHSTGKTSKYDPCSPSSRLGITFENIQGEDLTGISGLHFHTLCEQYTDDLQSTLDAIDDTFGNLLKSKQITWLNMGGGHWITKPDYNVDKLVSIIKQTRKRYDLIDIWLEPGEAVAIHTGTLESTVIDIVKNGDKSIAIVDVSATAHMPDTLEMPYRPDIIHHSGSCSTIGGLENQHKHNYLIGSTTCLAGDMLDTYSFPTPLALGDRLTFDDMAHYTMVKTTMFNGVEHPSIILKEKNAYKIVKEFDYTDFLSRLG